MSYGAGCNSTIDGKLWMYIVDMQGVSKKMSFLGKIAITTLKLIQNANVGGVSEN